MNERKGRNTGNFGGANTWETGSDNTWGNSTSSTEDGWGGLSGSTSNTWGSGSENTGNTWGSQSTGNDNSWGNDGNQGSNSWGDSADGWGAPQYSDDWGNSGTDKKRGRGHRSSFDLAELKPFLLIAAAIGVIGAIVYFIVSNAGNISNAISAFADSLSSAAITGFILTIVLVIVFKFIHFDLSVKTYVWIFVGATVLGLLKNLIPGLNNLFSNIVYIVLLVALTLFCLKNILK